MIKYNELRQDILDNIPNISINSYMFNFLYDVIMYLILLLRKYIVDNNDNDNDIIIIMMIMFIKMKKKMMIMI